MMTSLIDHPGRYNPAESTCPPLNLGDLADVALGYSTPRGNAGLRELIAAAAGEKKSRGQVRVRVRAIEAVYLLARVSQPIVSPGRRAEILAPTPKATRVAFR